MAKNNYVNNEDLLNALIVYQQSINDAKRLEQKKPILPDYIGLCIWQIATNVAKKKNFSEYSFIEDMVGDGVRNCLLYMHNFDPHYAAKANDLIDAEPNQDIPKDRKKPNPFAYFTQIIHYAFLGRIELEEKEAYVKYKSLRDSVLFTSHPYESNRHNLNLINSVLNEQTQDIISNFEEKQKRRQDAKKKKLELPAKEMPLDKFLI